MRVSIVDDSALIRRIVENALRSSGLELTEVLHAANGAEAAAQIERAALEGRAPHLILCDVHMPVMDGLGFLREKRARGFAPDAPVAMITADPSDPRLLEALAAGAAGFLAKPFSAQQILAGVAAWLPATGGETRQNAS